MRFGAFFNIILEEESNANLLEVNGDHILCHITFFYMFVQKNGEHGKKYLKKLIF